MAVEMHLAELDSQEIRDERGVQSREELLHYVHPER